MNLPPYRQVLECASPLALSALVRGRKSGRGLPQSKTLIWLRDCQAGRVHLFLIFRLSYCLQSDLEGGQGGIFFDGGSCWYTCIG